MTAAPDSPVPQPAAPLRPRDRRRLAALMVLAVAVFAVVAVTLLAPPPSGGPFTTTSFSDRPWPVLSATASSEPGGYSLQSSGPASGSASWAVLAKGDGSSANLSAIAFPSVNASLAYYRGVVASVSKLPGYSDLSGDLAPFTQYGLCYGYGESVEGITVVNGLCVKGNLFLMEHVVSGADMTTEEADLSTLMGALYSSVT